MVVLDSLYNASREALRRVENLAGRALKGFYQTDIRDADAVTQIFTEHNVSAFFL